ncbi:hypothetical protein U9M48_021369 [Paspalum notatum var. saurae]|uniref:Uncharacterized protein n=1 Tax=Paspalum notatum var. saurae TaxID=547442 RepID=A0AAQ3TIX1_PASNO
MKTNRRPGLSPRLPRETAPGFTSLPTCESRAAPGASSLGKSRNRRKSYDADPSTEETAASVSTASAACSVGICGAHPRPPTTPAAPSANVFRSSMTAVGGPQTRPLRRRLPRRTGSSDEETAATSSVLPSSPKLPRVTATSSFVLPSVSDATEAFCSSVDASTLPAFTPADLGHDFVFAEVELYASISGAKTIACQSPVPLFLASSLTAPANLWNLDQSTIPGTLLPASLDICLHRHAQTQGRKEAKHQRREERANNNTTTTTTKIYELINDASREVNDAATKSSSAKHDEELHRGLVGLSPESCAKAQSGSNRRLQQELRFFNDALRKE